MENLSQKVKESVESNDMSQIDNVQNEIAKAMNANRNYREDEEDMTHQQREDNSVLSTLNYRLEQKRSEILGY